MNLLSGFRSVSNSFSNFNKIVIFYKNYDINN